ncbi:MAG: RagB/SusD family nutrient uptake outer membrane protein [Paludibacteraceae bacterium]|nr:RagB/SusD family nutrient uptake outer membrane protein [Paludibacteraceae bacterium]
MKTINTYKVFALCSLLLALNACSEGFLSNNSPSSMEASTVFSSASRTEQAIYGVYNLMGANNGYRNRIACGYAGLNTDIEYSTKSTGSGDEPDLMLYDCGTANSRIFSSSGADLWSYLNTMIERSNNIIEGLEAYGNVENDPVQAYFLGEALFLRSFAYLEQVKYWGDVPARFVSLAKDPNGVNASKADRNIIYEQLRVDLRRAADLMPWSPDCPGNAQNNVGRGNKAAALALLARANLMYAGKAVRPGSEGRDIMDPDGYAVVFNTNDDMVRKAVYQEALEACAEIIEEEDYKLAADFAQPFKQICSDVTAYSQMEHIWVMPFNNGTRGQVLNYNAPKLSSEAQTTCNGVLPGYGGGSSNGHVCVSPILVYQFDKADKRRDVTFVTGQWNYDDASAESTNDTVREAAFPGVAANAKRLYQKHNQINTFYLGKYRFEWMAQGRSHTGTDDGIDFPVLRYSDVLLMFAEAAIGGIGGDVPENKTGMDPVQIFNKVRTRAGVPTVGTVTMEDIIEERAFELCGEYVRKWDLMRWGILRERMVAAEATIRQMAADGSRHAMNIGDSIYYTYRYDATVGGWMMDSIYGLALGETSRPAYAISKNGWLAKDIYNSDSKGYVLGAAQYPMFRTEEKLDTRQYWPIYNRYVAASDGALWNNYGYGNE